MKYLEYLEAYREIKQKEIEEVMKYYKTEPVGSGYIDIITPFAHIEKFIEELTNIKVVVECVTWWCHSSEKNTEQYGCPHGMGGPVSSYFDGWFSEMGFEFETFEIPTDDLEQLNDDSQLQTKIGLINDTILSYINDLSKAREYSKCMTPALWLHVPEEWKRIRYMK
ncbi:hypothetical protein BACCIP111895_00762 [Neobacillus rhizosphaerae]|uniref:Uncharacterized protein n=1 Tax=Neobacillus rhizosphaerae TaxID=2880965 RepID=A0ABN8KJI8_9BACI|nr:hypothetical protein [Neobacillus rhizosphaerae]CAH2713626.1 hypothetical protein BACCIP111895_00762 [Neobacillus rhizosphaerae]